MICKYYISKVHPIQLQLGGIGCFDGR